MLKKVTCQKAVASSLSIGSPMNGELVSLNQVPDEVFSSGMMGKGVAILPGNGSVVAPCDGAITYNRTFCHMIGVTTNSGIDILIHVGLNTTAIEQGLIYCHVREKQMVRKGEPLLTINLDAIKNLEDNLLTMVLITNPDRCTSIASEAIGRKVKAGERVMTVF